MNKGSSVSVQILGNDLCLRTVHKCTLCRRLSLMSPLWHKSWSVCAKHFYAHLTELELWLQDRAVSIIELRDLSLLLPHPQIKRCIIAIFIHSFIYRPACYHQLSQQQQHSEQRKKAPDWSTCCVTQTHRQTHTLSHLSGDTGRDWVNKDGNFICGLKCGNAPNQGASSILFSFQPVQQWQW